MSDEPKKARTRLTAEQHLTRLFDAKKAEVEKLHQRAQRLHNDWKLADAQLTSAQHELKRFAAAMPTPKVGTADQPVAAAEAE